MSRKINVCITGLSFGLEFVPIYMEHPDVDKVYVCDKDPKLLKIAQDRYSIPDEYCTTDLDAIIDNPGIDAVHLVTPPATHAPFSIKVLNAGKHCGCTIPMGMSIQELKDVIAARKASGKNYMFMETTIFQREYLYMEELYRTGKLGRLQYMSCAHYQDMEGWPEYWEGFPPLMHPTHAVAPCLQLAGHLPLRVYGRGSGKINDRYAAKYGCPYAFESAFITLEDSDVTIEMERFLYGVARSYSECFRIYGENMSFEWQQLAHENPVIYTRTGALGMTSFQDGEVTTYHRGGEILESVWKSRIMPICFPRRSSILPAAACTTTRTRICPLSRAADTAGHIRTWSMTLFVPSLRNVRQSWMTSWVPIGPVPASARMSPPCRAAR